jgi:glycosyl transferase family 25
MDTLLRLHGLEYIRVPAVQGSLLSGGDLDYASDDRRRHLTAGELGCLLSHIHVWRRFLNSSAQFAVVLEDDLHFSADFGDFIRKIELSTSEICIHKIETFLARATLQRAPKASVAQRAAFELMSAHGGSAAYIINRPAASYLLAHASEFRNPVDWELFDPDKRCASHLKVYQWLPAPTHQDFILGHKAVLSSPSSIGRDRSFMPVQKDDVLSGVVDAIKSALRPAYTAFYSAWLWRKGQRRARIRFG